MKKLLLASLISATIFSYTPVCAMDASAEQAPEVSVSQSAARNGLIDRIKTGIQSTLKSKKFWAIVAIGTVLASAAAYYASPTAGVAGAYQSGALPPIDIIWEGSRRARTPLFGVPYTEPLSWVGIATPNGDCEAVLNSDHAKNLLDKWGLVRCMEVSKPVYKDLASMKAKGIVDVPLVDNAWLTASKRTYKSLGLWSRLFGS